MLKDRKGFAKLAIQTGASLVPVFSFGENDIFDQPENPKVQRFQNFIKTWIGITPPIINGSGFLQNSYGLIPRRCPITTVIGAPIESTQNASPTEEEISGLHQKFIDELNKLFEHHKQEFDKNADTKLLIE